jgi:hypothetical protein
MSGKDGIRGYLVQTLIALLEALQCSNWQTIILEPAGDAEKFDILLKGENYTKKIQVKSSASQISKPNATRWAKELEQYGKSDESVLILVGNCTRSVAKLGFIGRVKLPPPKNLDLKQLIHEAAHLLDKFLSRECLAADSPEQRELLVHALITALTRYSAEPRPKPLDRSSFVQLLKDWLPASTTPPKQSLRLPALSKIPRSCRTGFQPNVIGRDTEIAWLKQTAGDKLIYAQPGMGKTFLLQHYAYHRDAYFLTTADLPAITEAIRQQQPAAVLIEDGQLNLETIRNLKFLRRSNDLDFEIIVDAWPGDFDQLVDTMDLSKSATLELSSLGDDSIVKIIKTSGLEGPNALLHAIVHQSSGCPGRAVMLIDACLQKKIEDWRDVWTGEKLARWARAQVKKLIGDAAVEVLACCSLGGSDGIRESTAASILKRSESEVRCILHSLALGGLIVDLGGGKVMVVPEPLRGILVKDVFFRKVAPVSFEDAVREVGLTHGLVKTAIAARAHGAGLAASRLLELVQSINSNDVWREYACSSNDHGERVIQDHPELIPKLADVLLRTVPERVIPRLLELAARDLRPEHQAPEHPIRRIRDWVQSGSPRRDALQRREIALEAFRRFVKMGRDCNLAIPLIPVILSPLFVIAEQSPADRESFRCYHGGLSDNDLLRIQSLWNAVFDTLEPHQLNNWTPILAAIQAWLFPYFGPSGVSPEQLRVLRSSETEILFRAARLAFGRPGVLSSLRRLATRRNFSIEVTVDETFEVIFPQYFEEDGEPKWDHLVFNVKRLAERLVRERTIDVVRKIQWCIVESEQMLDAKPGLCFLLCATIADLADDTIPWIEAMSSERCRADLLRPFLEKAAAHEPNSLAHKLRELLTDDDFRNEAVRVALVCNVPAEVRRMALAECSRVPDLVEKVSIISPLSNETITSLLTHPDHVVVSNALHGLWHAQEKRPLSDTIRQIWLKAAVRNLTDDWCLQQALSADSEFRMCWLNEQCVEGDDSRRFVSDKAFEAAVSFLTQEERCEILEKVQTSAVHAQTLVRTLVGGSVTIYTRLFRIHRLSRFFSCPLQRAADSEWVSLAICASTHGVSPDEIVSSSRKHYTLEFSEVPEKFYREMRIWESLASHDHSTVSDAARSALTLVKADLDDWQREKQLERF